MNRTIKHCLLILLSLVLVSSLSAWDRARWGQIGENSTDTMKLDMPHVKQYRTGSPSYYFDRVMIGRTFATATSTGELFLDGISERLKLSATGSMMIHGLISAVDTNTSRRYFGAWINGMLIYDGASGTRLVGIGDAGVVQIRFQDPGPGPIDLIATTTAGDGAAQLIASTTGPARWSGWLEIHANTE